MKKAFALVLSLALLFSFCGCNKISPQSSSSAISLVDFSGSSHQSVSETVSDSSWQSSSVESLLNSVSEGTSNFSSHTSSQNATAAEPQVKNYPNIKAIWLSQFDLDDLYTEGGKQRPKADFENKISAVLLNVKNNGFNTVFVQVRPYADSFYPSTLYPASAYVTGAYGVSLSYDPFDIIVKKARALNLSVHAWINPMRAMNEEEIKKVPNTYKIKKWYNEKKECLVNVNGRFYLNPAYSEVRKLIVDGAAEIARLYKIDGIHMDDYFYPTTSADFDKSAYSDFAKENPQVSLSDFRRRALNTLVSGIYTAVKAQNKELLFGISPAGNIDTVYNVHFADIYTWCSESGYIDYICPQVYFGSEHEFYPFEAVCRQWQDIIKNENIKLLIGMTLGKAKAKDDPYAGTGKDEWKESTDILKRCLEFTKNLEKCSGVAFFSYQYFYSPLSGAPDPDTKAERDNLIPLLKEIKWK